MIPDAEAAMIAATVEAILTGAQFATFLFCLRWHIYSDDGWSIRKRIRWPMLIITLLIMVFSIVGLSGSVQTILVCLKGTEHDLLSTTLISVRSLAIQSYRRFSDLVSAYVYGKVFNGSYNRWSSGSSIETSRNPFTFF